MKKKSAPKQESQAAIDSVKQLIKCVQSAYNKLDAQILTDVGALSPTCKQVVDTLLTKMQSGEDKDNSVFLAAVERECKKSLKWALTAKHYTCQTPQGIALAIATTRAIMKALQRHEDDAYARLAKLQKES